MQIRKHLTYANVVSSLSLFLLIGGSAAIAANHLGKNTVGQNQLKKNSVATAKLKNNAVTTGRSQPAPSPMKSWQTTR